MRALLPLLTLAVAASAASIQHVAPPSKAAAGWNYAVDFSQAATQAQMQCLATAGYSVAFVRGYSPAGNGQYDPNACTNVHNAYPCIGTEIFMTPQPLSTKPGYTQFDEMYTGLKNQGVNLFGAWVQVTQPSHWSTNPASNINFINSILSRMRQYGVRPGIYTCMGDWQQITGNWAGAGSDVMLWYYHVNGGGVSGETTADFSDFYPFGGWSFPTVKQYAQIESVCGLTVNRDIFYQSGSNFAAFLEGLRRQNKDFKPEKYISGMIGH